MDTPSADCWRRRPVVDRLSDAGQAWYELLKIDQIAHAWAVIRAPVSGAQASATL
jgi:hypothetical protein